MSTNSCNKESDVHATSSHSTPSNQRRIIKAKRPPGMSVVLSDEDLFKQPPKKDCPICMLPLPALESGSMYMICCGKTVCVGCMFAPVYDDKGKIIPERKCPFCRTPLPNLDKKEEHIKWLMKRVEAADAEAINFLGLFYRDGLYGLQQDLHKALELWHKAGELGCTAAYNGIGYAYDHGRGVGRDQKKAKHYFELAAIGGHAAAWFNLGASEECAGNMNRALKHYMIAVRSGQEHSLKHIQKMFSNGRATKDDYASALRAYQAYLGEIKSAQRDEAAAASEICQYY